nr:disease resistance protein Pik-2-like isoform X1 [Setaria viridis]XP_034606581.1 disease resistance protein Pik-2-like isoform X1 [Setaria viridis]
MASAATSVMGSIICKLTAMLGEKYQLAIDVKKGIRFLKDELSTMDVVLQKLADKEDDQMDPMAKHWRNKVRELSYDIEDCIDRFMLNHSHGGSNANFVRKATRKVEMLWEDQGIATEIQELEILVREQSKRAKRYRVDYLAPSPQPMRLDPRATALFQEARDPVGIDGPREEIIQLLQVEENQHKVVSIYGTAGQGKTTLAMEVCRKITEAFDCRAFVSVSQTLDMKKLLRDILSQIVSTSEFDQSESWDTEQLIRKMKDYLIDKRYFILIDDIWKVSDWELVECTLPRNCNGSRIITTTRSKTVAETCARIDGQMYKAKPLGDDHSRRLFFKRLFRSTEHCPQDLMAVSSDILTKCGGLPLAIISIAGLLANRSKTKEVWVNALKYISAAVDKDSHMDEMKRIFLLSYFDLPLYLKSCMLYLSVFPEDYLIDCRRLILLWVAEGLIPGQGRENMEQLGRSYLNELINRSLVQPTKVGADGTTVKECRVHDVILEFIVSKAVEENFVTIWNRNGFSENYSSNKIRRLSIQHDISWRAEEMVKIKEHAAHIRSINTFGSNSVLVKNTSMFLISQVLRVLNIEDWEKLREDCYLGHVRSFGQMKYLRLESRLSVCHCKLPEDIEKLQHLEILDVRCTSIEKLPASIIQLQRLVRLLVDSRTKLPDEIGKLHALEELSVIGLGSQTIKFIQGLRDLTNLKVLGIDWWYTNAVHHTDVEGHMKACISSLLKLVTTLRELYVEDTPDDTLSFMASCASTPPPLRRLVFKENLGPIVVPHQRLIFNENQEFIVLPHQIISSLVNLTRLCIGLVSQEGINILASLPMLLSLTVRVFFEEDDSELSDEEDDSESLSDEEDDSDSLTDEVDDSESLTDEVDDSELLSDEVDDSKILSHEEDEEGASGIWYTISSHGFQRLVKFNFYCYSEEALEFEPGAMPKLQRLKLNLVARGQFNYKQGGLVRGLQNLADLKHVALSINCEEATLDEVQGLEDDIRVAAGVHPNRPMLQVERSFQDSMAEGCSRRPPDHPMLEAQ